MEVSMSSEDWKVVLLSLIATGGSAFATFAAVMLWWLKSKADKADASSLKAVDAAAEMKSLVNGRMDQMLIEAKARAYIEGHQAGVAFTAKTLGESSKIPIDQQEVLKAVAVAQIGAPVREPPLPPS